MSRDSAEPSRERLREAFASPLGNWREVYESFSPVDVQTGMRRSRMPRPSEDPRRAAVLIPVVMDPSGPRLIYTVRRGHLNDHAGQISFPGGAADPSDKSLLATALREAAEEIDLPPDSVEIVGELEDMYIPPSNFLVRPFVGLIPPETALTLAPDEVEEIFSSSLAALSNENTLRRERWTRDGRPYEVAVFSVVDESGRSNPPERRYEIWGATAAITASLLTRLGWSRYLELNPPETTGRNPK